MSRFRATDEQLDREIETLQQIARIRLRRATRDMRELDRDLRELKREKARRRGAIGVPATPYLVNSTAES